MTKKPNYSKIKAGGTINMSESWEFISSHKEIGKLEEELNSRKKKINRNKKKILRSLREAESKIEAGILSDIVECPDGHDWLDSAIRKVRGTIVVVAENHFVIEDGEKDIYAPIEKLRTLKLYN